MCYADTTTHPDGTVTAFCYCGWTEEHRTVDAADRAAETHENADEFATAH